MAFRDSLGLLQGAPLSKEALSKQGQKEYGG